MSRLTDLMRQLHATDPQLGADLESEIRALTKRRNFGLVFERHQPEAVELPGIKPKRGDKCESLNLAAHSRKAIIACGLSRQLVIMRSWSSLSIVM